jgi:hypothetical protein
MEGSQNPNLWTWAFSVGTAVLAGMILLVIEYRTRWFARWLSSFQEQPTGQANPLASATLTPVMELENPAGDWIQVAEEVKRLLEQSTEEERQGEVTLLKIEPNKILKRAKLTFSFWAASPDDPNSISQWFVYTRISSEGRIINFYRECDVMQ